LPIAGGEKKKESQKRLKGSEPFPDGRKERGGEERATQKFKSERRVASAETNRQERAALGNNSGGHLLLQNGEKSGDKPHVREAFHRTTATGT